MCVLDLTQLRLFSSDLDCAKVQPFLPGSSLHDVKLDWHFKVYPPFIRVFSIYGIRKNSVMKCATNAPQR